MAAAEAEAAAWACMQLNMERRQRFTRSATLNFTTATHDGCKTVYRAYRNRGKTLTLVVTLRVSGGRDIYNRGLPRVLYSARIRAVSRSSPADRPLACPLRQGRAMRCGTAPPRARARTGNETVDPLRVREQASRSRRAPHSTARCSAQSPATRRRCVLAEPYS